MIKINTTHAPEAIWPYSQAIDLWDTIYTSWQIGLNPETMTLVWDDIESQTRRVCKNLEAVLADAWYHIENVIKTTVFLKNMDDFPKMNTVYWEYFPQKPARSTIEVTKLPLWALVEIEVIAKK